MSPRAGIGNMLTRYCAKRMSLYVIDAYKVARDSGMGTRINTVMQTCFFAISGVLPPDAAIDKIKQAIKKTYGKKGEEVVRKNFEAVDNSVANLHQVEVPATTTSTRERPSTVPPEAPVVMVTPGPMVSVPPSVGRTWLLETALASKLTVAVPPKI